MATSKQERIRVDIWTSLRPVIEAEMQRSGLSAQEVINIALVDYFGLSPKSKRQIAIATSPTQQEQKEQQNKDEEEDYI